MRKRGSPWNAASTVARRRGLPEQPCRTCRGRDIDRHLNPETETGFDVLDPCPGCEGYGVAFRAAPVMVWTASELLERFPSS